MSEQTTSWAPWVFGDDGVPLDDPAETYHEASRISRVSADHRVRGQTLLQLSPELRRSAARASARRAGAAMVSLPSAAPLGMRLDDAIRGRRSGREHAPCPITLVELAQLLRAGYGVTGTGPEGVPLRAAPSAGALYPLDVYVAASAVDALDRAIYHYDVPTDLLELGRTFETDELANVTPSPELVRDAAAVLVIAASFWRSRFKYGQRGYRFALLEAGHVAQNVLLAATALGLASVAVGGFFDREANELLDLDGLHEAVLYLLPIAHPAETTA